MSSVLHALPSVHSNPGPHLRQAGRAAGYEGCRLAEADAPREPRLPLADWIECQAGWFRSQETSAAAFVAGELQQLAELARVLRAATVEQFVDRREALAAKGGHL